MSIQCDNTTPIASKAGSLTVDSGVFDNIIDLSSLITTTDPLDRLNRSTIVGLTDLTNSVLNVEDLSGFPTLSNRFGQTPLTYTEIAAYVLDNNVDASNLLNEFKNYNNVNGPSATITTFFDELDFFYNQNFGKTISEGACGEFANALTELAAAFTLLNTVVDKLSGLNLKDLDLKKQAIALAQKLKIDAIAASIQETIEKIVEKIKRKVLQATKSIIPQLKKMGCAKKALFKKIRREIDQINDFFSEENIQNIKDSIEKFISEMVANFERMTLENVMLMMYKLCQFTETIQSILSGPGDKLNRIVEATAIELKSLQTLGLINTKEAVKAGAPRVSSDERAKKISDAKKKLDVTDPCPTPDEIQMISEISDAGLGPYITFSSSVVSNKEWQDIDNSVWSKLIRITSQTNEGYEAISEQRLEELARLDTDGDGEISDKEAGNVVKVKAESRYDFVKRAFGEAFNWTSDKLGIEVTEKDGLTKTLQPGDEGYVTLLPKAEPDTYEVLHGVKKKTDVTSKMGGTSNHIHLTGFAVDISINDDNRIETIIAASRAGFSGIGVYKTFLHLDVGTRRSWVAGQPGIDIKQTEKFAGDALSELQYLLEIHNIDGFRKPRGDTTTPSPYSAPTPTF